MNEVYLRAVNISKSFSKGKNVAKKIEVLKRVNLEVRAGERLAIMGQSGAGKSTLLHVLGTLDTPDEGDLYFLGESRPLNQLGADRLAEFRNRSMGFVFQFHYLIPELTALENAALPARLSGVSKERSAAMARELLLYLGLENRLNHRPFELSGGEQQRVSIARAIIQKPKILFADELTGNLDSENAQKVLDILVQLNEASRIAMVLVTHDQAVARSATRVLWMKDGVLVDNHAGTP